MTRETCEATVDNATLQSFVASDSLRDILDGFENIRACLGLGPDNCLDTYSTLKSHFTSEEAQRLFKLLDTRAALPEYDGGNACKGKRVLVIGAGPCGLRMAIEAALLGARVDLVEMRDYFSRNNVLHIWPFLIQDLKAIGLKVIYPQFCVGPVNHISIRRLQIILVKIALILGVQVHTPVTFDDLEEPTDDHGWRAKVLPSDHPVSRREFDFVIAADAQRDSLKGFERQCFRGKLAIAITANFVNHKTKEEARVPEIPGIFYIFRQDFFNGLREKTGIDLENLVFFKDETHYFVMTAKKSSLLTKGVLKKDFQDTAELLAPSNVDRQALQQFALQAADESTNHEMPSWEFARDHRGDDDVAIFDFTAMHQATHASLVRKKHGKQLVLSIIGDSLVEPFWPTGSGCARGFLGVFDTAWMMKHTCMGERPLPAIVAERESIFQMLSQTSPNTLNKHINKYTIDPMTRYGTNPKMDLIKPHQVKHLFICDKPEDSFQFSGNKYITGDGGKAQKAAPTGLSRQNSIIKPELLAWYRQELSHYEAQEGLPVTDLCNSWRSGVALCCLLHRYRPQLIDINTLESKSPAARNTEAFNLLHEEFGVAPLMTGEELADNDQIDNLSLLAYLVQLKETLMKHQPDSSSNSDIPSKASTSITRLQRRPSAFGMLMMVSGNDHKKMVEEEEPSQPVVTRRRKQPRDQEKQEETQYKRRTVSDMASMFQTMAESRPREQNKSPRRSIRSGDRCCLCNKKLYVVERHSVHGYFFHRSCFRCAECNTVLRVGNYAMHKLPDAEVKFYCTAHYYGRDLHLEGLGRKSVSLPEAAVPETTPETSRDEPDCGVKDDTETMPEESIKSDVLEEDESSSEESDDSPETQEDVVNRREKRAAKDEVGRQSCSQRLLEACNIQQELGDLDEQESVLVQEGVRVEEDLRAKDAEGAVEPETASALMEVLKKKQEFEDKVSRLMLQVRLLAKQDEKRRLSSRRKTSEPKAVSEEEEGATGKVSSRAKLAASLKEIELEIKELRTCLGEQ